MKTITIQTTIAATIEKTWHFFSHPEHIQRWNAASEDWHCPKATNDLQIGGKFTYTMASKNGEFSFDFSGIYTKIVFQKTIEYAIEDGRKVAVFMEEIDGYTTVTEIFEPENLHPLEMQQQGWQSILDNFKKHTETTSF